MSTATAENTEATWVKVCDKNSIAPDTGVCALVNGHQVAIFYSRQLDELFAVGNYDPLGKAYVLSRGLIGSQGERFCVASPLYKQHFDLRTGECLEEEGVSIPTYELKLEGDWISVRA